MILSGPEISLEVTVDKLNGVEVEYTPEYDNLNSGPGNTFAEEFENEVHIFLYVCVMYNVLIMLFSSIAYIWRTYFAVISS